MQKWISEGLTVSMASIVIGGGASILAPENPKVTLAGSSLGAIASSIVLAKRNQQVLSKTELQLKAAQAEIITHQSTTHHSQANLNALEAQLKSTNSELLILQSEASLARANFSTLESQLKLAQAELLAAQTEASNAQSELSTLLEQLEQKFDEAKAEVEATFDNRYSEATFIIDHPSSQDEDANCHGDEAAAIAWFANKNISIESQYQPQTQDKILNKHAIYLGEHLKDENGEPLLAPLLKQIRWAISQNRGVQYHFKKASQNQTRIVTLFCRNLLDDSLLSSYRYNKNNDQKIIHAAVQDRADIRGFFDGTWFERFICHRVCSIFDNLSIQYSFLMNPIIKFANGDKFELDLFFLVSEKPLLIECKTGGNFTGHIKRFSERCKRLSLPVTNAYLVILDLEDAQAENISQLWKFTVVNQDGLTKLIQNFSPNS